MDDEERVLECQKEIRRLRSVVRELDEETWRLKRLVQCIGRGALCEGVDLEKILVIGGADLGLHGLLKEVLNEELMACT